MVPLDQNLHPWKKNSTICTSIRLTRNEYIHTGIFIKGISLNLITAIYNTLFGESFTANSKGSNNYFVIHVSII